MDAITGQEDHTEWVILDTETDGLDYPIHVLEVAAQRMRGTAKDGEPFRIFLNHGIPIPSAATAIHGYTQAFLAAHGAPPREAYEKLREYVGARRVAAHYLRYDWNAVLLPELRRLRVDGIGQQGICTWNLSRRAIPEYRSHSLDSLRHAFRMPTIGAHSAIGDVETVYLLLRDIIFPRLEKIGIRGLYGAANFSSETPILKCHCLIEGISYDEAVRRLKEQRAERKARQELIDSIRSGSVPDVPELLCSRGFITQDPAIDIRGRTFLFTGKMVWGSRPEVTKLIESLGGFVSTSKVVGEKINYLVLGEDAEKGWTRLLHGGKLSDAVCRKIENEESRLQIVLESAFIDSLMTHLEHDAQAQTGI